MEDYFYELNYKDGDTTVKYKFDASICIDEFAEKMARFMYGCSWSHSQVKGMFKKGLVD